MVPCSSIPAIKCLSKINSDTKKGAPHFAHSLACCQQEHARCLRVEASLVALFQLCNHFFFHLWLLSNRINIQSLRRATMLSHSLIIHDISSHPNPPTLVRKYTDTQARTALQRLPTLVLGAACVFSVAQKCLAKKNPGVRSLWC